jgi:hypothetical protein
MTYCVTIRLRVTGHVQTIRHSTPLDRALTVISLGPYVDIVRTFEEGE